MLSDLWNKWSTFQTQRDAPEYNAKVIIRRIVNGIEKLNQELALEYEVSIPTQRKVVARRERKYDLRRVCSAWLKGEKLSSLDVKRTLTIDLRGSALSFSYFLPDTVIGCEERSELEDEVDRIIMNAFYSDPVSEGVFQWVDKEVEEVIHLREQVQIPRVFVIFTTILFCLPVLAEYLASLFGVPIVDLGQNVASIEGLESSVKWTLNMNLWVLHLSVCLTVFCAYLTLASKINSIFLDTLERIDQRLQNMPDCFANFIRKSFFRGIGVSVRTWSLL